MKHYRTVVEGPMTHPTVICTRTKAEAQVDAEEEQRRLQEKYLDETIRIRGPQRCNCGAL